MIKKRFGITGSNGFIGNHLLNQLPEMFHDSKIIPFDPRKEGIPPALDFLYHLGFSSPIIYKKYLEDAQSTDLYIAEKLAVYCINNKTTLIFTSSSAVYAPSDRPVIEDDKICPVNSYGQANYEAERLFMQYSNSGEFPLIILRLFNLYGAGQSKDHVIPQILDALIKKRSLIIQQPDSGRDFIYIDDCISALLKASTLEDKQIIINIGTGIETKISEIVAIISRIFQKDYKNYIKVKSNSFSHHNRSIANIDRMVNSLNFSSLIPLELGLKKLHKVNFY